MINDSDSHGSRKSDTYTISEKTTKSNGAAVPDSGSGAGSISAPSSADAVAAAAHAAVPNWANLILMVFLILGGCCTNVFALEAIIKEQSTAGPLITFAQFLLCAIFTLPHFFTPSAGLSSLFLKPRAIPLRSWIIYTAYFVSVNLLNNWAFAYKISVPLHIILRSGGPVASMIVGVIFNNRRYSTGQVLSVAMLTLGVMASALADAKAKGQSIGISTASANADRADTTTTIIGFSILALAMILSAFQGIYADRLYAHYGRDHWKEALFYSHVLSLPVFFSSWSQLYTQWQIVYSSPPLSSYFGAAGASTSKSALIQQLLHSPLLQPLSQTPIQVLYLLINALTQYLCIRGVHLLSAKSSSLTVTVALNVRKLVSLLLSIYLFGNSLSQGVLAGAVLVFLGGGLYGVEGARLRNASNKNSKEKKKV